MKKTIALILAALCMLTAFAACAQTGAPKQQTSPSAPASSPSVPAQPTNDTPTSEEPTSETPTPEPPTTEEVLAGKKVLFCGDSICMASTHDKDHKWWGWAGRINKNYGLKLYKNAGVDGASVSNCRNTNTIVNQVINNRSTYFDMVVLHGGVNDAWDSTEVGAMIDKPASETLPADCDLSTFAGGLENLIYQAKKYYPASKICYVINFRLNSSQGRLRDMTEYVEATKQICDKWGIPYLDLYFNRDFEKQFKNDTGRCLADGIHPNSRGYDILAPYIADFMASVFIASADAK